MVHITTVYDNTALDPNLACAWGFACLVGDELLFDTGGNGRKLLFNMEQLGIDPAGIQTVVLSHAHGDHTGGLEGLLSTGIQPVVYAPCSFPTRFKVGVCSLTSLVEVAGPVEILPGIHTTGEMGARIVEQALVVQTAEGIVVATGCAHPGIVEMVRKAKEMTGSEVALVIGGFHLSLASEQRIAEIIGDLRDLGVRKVAPCHCTGDQAMRMMAKEYRSDFVEVGAGSVVTLGSGEEQRSI
jgi:7,8-dihydropterin-6-yl-methyl-4-(beta-D-ribofuranosyl)aminobenzene 5'-phosphate synthase